MKREFNKSLLNAESLHVKELKKIVQKTVDEEAFIMDNLMHPPEEKSTNGDKLSDKVARFGGSWRFIIIFSVILFVWILLNSILPKGTIFDPYPFILMNLVLSTIAALQAPIIMMSQNRQEVKDRKRAENDYLINLKSELEVRTMNQKVDILLEKQIKTLFEIQSKQLEMLNEIIIKMKV